MEKMKAVEIKEPEVLRIIETDKPAIDETNNVLVKMKAAGICGSDIGIGFRKDRDKPPVDDSHAAGDIRYGRTAHELYKTGQEPDAEPPGMT